MTVLERFLKYVSYPTASCEQSETFPSTEKQLLLGKVLAEDLKEIGLSDVTLDQNGYVYGFLPATKGRENEKALGLIAHMDTSPDAPDKVNPSVIEYTGGDICLPFDTIREKDFPNLAHYVGQNLVVTDGSSLLGADDKAGVAEIFTVCETLIKNNISHRAVAVCITPDEEIGSGADRFPLEKFGADEAYTIDGGELGEIEYENFNGASAEIIIKGVNIHPGEAKNKMKNAALLAAEFVSLMPAAETPAHTEGYEGFYHISDIEANESLATIRMIIRDHDKQKFEERKEFVRRLVEYLNQREGGETITAKINDSYYNMKEKILPFMYLIDNAKAAMLEAGVEPKVIAIRGGTDGARLSYEGLPCPNLSTGGANFHGVHEFISVQSMEKMVEVIINLVK